MSKTYIITGGAGFIGSALAAHLNRTGIENIVIVDELRSGDKWKNLVNLRYADFVHKAEFLRRVQEDRLPSDVAAIVHLGACSATTERDADYLMDNNFKYTRALAEYSLEKDIRFIYASSGATYGRGDAGYSDDDETTRTLKPLNMYGYSKQLMDLWALQTGVADKIAGLKFFNVFGPNEYHKGDMQSMVSKAHRQIREEGTVQLFKSELPEYRDGEQMRDFVYVKDCVAVMDWLLQNPSVGGIYNVGSGKARTWKDLMHAVFAALGKEPSIEYIPLPDALRGRYQYFTEAPIEKLRAAGYTAPMTSLEDAVRDYVTNYLETSDPYLP
jgi:ADP-L-glycero-D-manno-heptose 6-epimerase